MPKSKNRKNHKKKVESRNFKLKEEKKKNEKMQKKFLMDLIKKEQEKGKFENTKSVNEEIVQKGLDINSEEGPQV